MNYGTQMVIAWMMFKEWLKETFGGGVKFPTEPLAPNYVQGYSK